MNKSNKKRTIEELIDEYSITFTQDSNIINVKLIHDENNNCLHYYFDYYGSSTRASEIEIFCDDNENNLIIKTFNVEIIKNDKVIKSFNMSGQEVLDFKSDTITPSINDYIIKFTFDDINLHITLNFRHLYKWSNKPTELSGVKINLY